MDYSKRLDELEAKLEREGLTENEKAEIAIVRSKALRELRKSTEEALARLEAGMRALEELKNFKQNYPQDNTNE